MIVPLVRVTFYGLLGEKAQVLEELQAQGCLHLLPLRAGAEGEEAELAIAQEVRDSLQFLLASPLKRQQRHDPEQFDAARVQRHALETQAKMRELEDRRDFLRRRIRDLEPWGDFTFPPRDRLRQQRLWFYIVPHYLMPRVAETELVWQTVHRDTRHCYVVVLAEDVPQGMPVERTRTGDRPLSELRRRLERVESELEDQQVERWRLTCWLDQLAGSMHRLENRAARDLAATRTHDTDPLFVLQAWAPKDHLDDLRTYAETKGLALVTEEPNDEDAPPTLLRNPTLVRGGQDLVSFYSTPSYDLWDPSPVVFFSFAVFFAMILSDAGYALLLGLPLLFKWKAMGTTPVRRGLRNLWLTLTATSAAWGIAVGSYFGLAPPEGGPLASVNLLDVRDSTTMMKLSVAVGLLHVAFANAVGVWRLRRSAAMLVPLGWLVILLTAGFWGLSHGTVLAAQGALVGPWGLAAGGTLVLLFSGLGAKPFGRLFQGLIGVYRVTNAFGDVLSYLRLFALGLASASLATAFNDLARQVAEDMPAFGMLLALIVLLFGHGLNFLLAVVSGFVHGLRLNFIEFFNWGVPEEGRPFRAFAKKEAVQWNP